MHSHRPRITLDILILDTLTLASRYTPGYDFEKHAIFSAGSIDSIVVSGGLSPRHQVRPPSSCGALLLGFGVRMGMPCPFSLAAPHVFSKQLERI